MPDPLASLDDVAWPIRTERLLLRRALPQDADAVWRYRSLPVVAEFMTALISDSAEFAVYFSDADRLARTVVVEIADEPRAVVGDLMVRVQDAWSQTEVVDRARGTQAEIGWAFHPDHQGRGYATEAVRELLRVCFEDLGLHRVEALCFAANTPSWRLMERLGMRRENRNVEDSLHRSGTWMDGLGYAMLDREWRAHPESDRHHPDPGSR